jgi:predicted secreted protein
MLKNETKTVDIEIVDGEPVVQTTWTLFYEDGSVDYLQRRQPVTDPAERESILNAGVDVVEINVQLPGAIESIIIKGILNRE